MGTEPNNAALLPCPFCGKNDLAVTIEHQGACAGLWVVKCATCGRHGRYARESEDAVEKWNTRAMNHSGETALREAELKGARKMQEAAALHIEDYDNEKAIKCDTNGTG